MPRLIAASLLQALISVHAEYVDIPPEFNATLDRMEESLGDAGSYMVNWVKQRLGTKIAREGHTATSCWDLVMAAVEAANKAGYNVPTGHSGTITGGYAGWVWSDQPISWTQAQPGDVVQFAYWYEYYSHSWKSTADKHSALITSVTSTQLNVYEQNPSAAHAGTYHPKAARHKGVLQAFRMTSGSSPSPPPSTCTDLSGWKNQDGDTCYDYSHYHYCTIDGQKGSGWDTKAWGELEDWYDSAGRTAMVACCCCGGGTRSANVTDVLV